MALPATNRRPSLSPSLDGLELPWPALLPPLDFDPSQFHCSFDECNDLEKAVERRLRVKASFDSDATTLPPGSTSSLVTVPKADQEPYPLPPKRYCRMLRGLRYSALTVYHRIFSLIFVVNLIGLFLLLRSKNSPDSKLNSLAIWASANLLVSIFIRQDYLVNLIFATAWMVPWKAPLRLRRIVTRVYTYGGIHTGAAVAGTVWFVAFTIFATTRFIENRVYTAPILVLSWAILTLLLSICLLAFPSIRARHHDAFEISHRLLGWTTIILFWAQFLLLTCHVSATSASSFGHLVVRSPIFWNLMLMSIMIIYPWLRLQKWTFHAEILSSHAIRLHFTHPIHKFACLNLSSSPLREWHPFATFPTLSPAIKTDRRGASLVVSAAGDWTKALIKEASTTPTQPRQFWVKGYPRPGVLSLSVCFARIVILTTGSGIGPCLASLLNRPAGQAIRLIWSTRSPLRTYGPEILSLVKSQDEDAMIIDTDSMGRPDLVRLAWRMCKDVNAEAVFVLSNATVTRKVVYGLESRGVPAFGPIWDS